MLPDLPLLYLNFWEKMNSSEVESGSVERPESELPHVGQHVSDGRLRRVEAQLLVAGRGTFEVGPEGFELFFFRVLEEKLSKW